MVVSEWLRDSPGRVLDLYRRTPAGLTISEAAQISGLSRTALTQRVGLLRDAGLLVSAASPSSGPGRPALVHRFAHNRGYLLVADTGVTGMRLALTDAAGGLLAETYRRFTSGAGPDRILRSVLAAFGHVLRTQDLTEDQVLGIAVSVPGPVDEQTGLVVRPPSMPGWHNFDIKATLATQFACPSFIETDANAMAIGEHRRQYPLVRNLAFIKLGTGISTGLVLGGEIYRGSEGAAGEIGHTQWSGEEPGDKPSCRCGNEGCLEAYASGWALVRDFTTAGIRAESVNDIVTAVRRGHTEARRLVQTAALRVGTAISDLVTLLNPERIVVGGQLSELDEIVLAAIRERVYSRALPLATRRLQVSSALLPDPGVHGLALLAADRLHSPHRIDKQLGT